MRIIQVVYGFSPYNMVGTEIYTYNLSRQLVKRHNVFVFHRVNDLHAEEYALTHNKFDNLEIFRINNTFRLYNSFEMTYKNDVVAEKFSWILDQIKPDIVHIQHLLYLSTKIIEQIKKRKIPIVFTLHDYWLICPQGQLFKKNMDICNRENNLECINCILYQLGIKQSIFNAYYFMKRAIPGYLFHLLKNIYLSYYKLSFLTKSRALRLIEERIAYIKDICLKVDLFISPSKFLKRKYIEFGISKDKIIFLPYGFNLNNFKNFQRIPSDRLRFGFIGNLLPAKGTHILIESFNKIKSNKVELRIYGQVMSYKGILGNYLHRIKKMARNKNIKFMGGFDSKDVAKIFQEIDVLVVSSIWYENSPLVIQEAFATKTPVIASNIGGIPELVSDGINGLLFRPSDVNELKEKLEYIIDKPEIINKFKEHMPEVKSIEENVKEIEEIYSTLIN